jgi:superfamily II DNA/RNA helicase
MLVGCLCAGTGAVIIAPTRELALQIYGVARQLMKYHHQTHGMIVGGASRKYTTALCLQMELELILAIDCV